MAQYQRAAILGATGPTGIGAVSALAGTARAIRVVSRSDENLRAKFPGDDVERVVADVTRPDETARAVEGCDLVFDCIGLPAGLMHQHPLTARNIAAATGDTGSRCVQISSYWAYLPIDTMPLTEEHPRTGGPDWAKYRREAEDVLQEAGAAILHLPDFYGPDVHTSTIQNALLDAAKGSPMNWIGSPDVAREGIYVPDAMKLAASLAAREEAFGERWVLPGSGPLTGRELEALVSRYLDEPAKLRAASPFLLRIVSLFDKDLRSFLPMVPFYAQPISFDASKLEALVGKPSMTPYADGVRDTLRAIRDA